MRLLLLDVSQDVDRTLTSALSTLAGLFPPECNEYLNEKIMWQPIPVHTQPRKDDFLLVGEKRCDRYDYLMLQYMNGSEYQGFFEQHRRLITFLEKNSGMKLPTMTAIFDLFDTLYVEKLSGKR